MQRRREVEKEWFVLAFFQELERLADYSFIIPSVQPLLSPLAMAGLMQFFIYQIANELDCPIDRPRNIRKTVTIDCDCLIFFKKVELAHILILVYLLVII